jgi:GTP cyclohydrolase II
LFSLRCDCGEQLALALEKIAQAKRGLLIYLPQEGRGIGLLNKIKAYHLQDQGHDTVEANELLGFAADLRDYSACPPILARLGVKRLALMTNNPQKIAALTQAGIEIVERIALKVSGNPHNKHYLATKAEKLGHLF